MSSRPFSIILIFIPADLRRFSHLDRDAALRERSVSEQNGSESEREVSSQDDSDTARATSTDEAAQDLASSDSPSPRPSSFRHPFLSFREPDKNIQRLRQLALQGREETLREQAEGREKVVWGSVEGDGQLRRVEGDCLTLGSGTLPSADDRSESFEVGGAVGVRVGELDVDDDAMASVSAPGLTHAERPLDDGRKDP